MTDDDRPVPGASGTSGASGTAERRDPSAARRLRRLRARRRVATSGFRAAMAVVPASDLTLVAGLPDSEENSLVTAVRVRQRCDGRVVLVGNDPQRLRVLLERVATALGAPDAVQGIELVAKASPRSAAAFVQARLVFYTHGLFDSPRPVGGRLHVNLWHGTGPKWTGNTNVTQRIGAQAHVAASPAWGRETARALSMGPDVAIVPGNPRQDLLGTLAGDDAARVRRALALADRPFALWMPTFRTSERAGTVGLSEGRALHEDPLAARLAGLAEAHGVDLVVKPHRLDAERFAALGVRVVDDAELERAGVTLTQFTGLAAGMLSDYSSAWVDHLPTGRPVGLYCPDLAAYVADRGFNRPPLDEVAAGLMLDTDEDAHAFFDAVASGAPFRPEARQDVVTGLGIDLRPAVTDRMLDALRELALDKLGSPVGIGGRPAQPAERAATSS